MGLVDTNYLWSRLRLALQLLCPHIVFQIKTKTRMYEGLKVVQCIKDMLCLWLLFALKTRKMSLIMKNWFIGVSDQVVLKTKEAQLHKKPNYSFELHSGYMCLSYNYHKIKFSHVGAQV